MPSFHPIDSIHHPFPLEELPLWPGAAAALPRRFSARDAESASCVAVAVDAQRGGQAQGQVAGLVAAPLLVADLTDLLGTRNRCCAAVESPTRTG